MSIIHIFLFTSILILLSWTYIHNQFHNLHKRTSLGLFPSIVLLHSLYSYTALPNVHQTSSPASASLSLSPSSASVRCYYQKLDSVWVEGVMEELQYPFQCHPISSFY
ncbi:hypothetical protein EDB19DRAFT_1366396 [Suillus lakei]|nr:hypothetical protein EDB19DRAFT_1366396 [Suillus lakei]